jgi:hypothetical protein
MLQSCFNEQRLIYKITVVIKQCHNSKKFIYR